MLARQRKFRVNPNQVDLFEWLARQTPANDAASVQAPPMLLRASVAPNALPMNASTIIRTLGGKHRSGAQKAAMSLELERLYDKMQAHACVMLGDDRAAVMMFRLFAKIEVQPPIWMGGLFLENREALEEAVEAGGVRDPDEGRPSWDIYEEEM